MISFFFLLFSENVQKKYALETEENPYMKKSVQPCVKKSKIVIQNEERNQRIAAEQRHAYPDKKTVTPLSFNQMPDKFRLS